MKQTLISSHFLSKNPENLQILPPPFEKPQISLKRKRKTPKTDSALEKKVKLFETPSNIPKKAINQPFPLNWKGVLKEETPLSEIFTYNPCENTEISTTKGTSEWSNSFVFSSINKQVKTPISSFRRISFEEEPEYNTVIQKNSVTGNFSKETEQILEQIKSKSSLKNERIDENKEDYIENEDFKRILTKFATLENALLMCYFRKEPSFYKNLHEITKITLKELKQILFLFPTEYSLKWERNNQYKQEIDLFIQFPPDFFLEKQNLLKNIDKRSELFKKRIKSFINANNKGVFIPEYTFPEKPNAQIESIKDFLKSRKKPENPVLLSIMSEIASKTQDFNVKSENSSIKEPSLLKKGLKESLIEKIKMKEKILEKEQKVIEKPKRIEEMINIVEIVKYHFTLKNVSNIFLMSLVDFIHSSNTVFILNKEEIMRLLKQISEFAPDWLKILDNEHGKIVRIDREIPIFKVLSMIKAIN